MTNSNIEIDSAGSNVKMNLEPQDEAAVSVIEKDPEIVKEKEVIRVMLWTAPRSLSTAFERCMTRVPNAKIFNEMYGAAFLLGPERKVRWWPKLTPKHSYKHCKERMEADHPNYDFVFAKDFAFEMHKHTDMLPIGYQHTFLIRHPVKVFKSLRKMLCSSLLLKFLSCGSHIKTCFPTDGYFYEDMWELYKYLRDNPDHPVPIIMDADDLIKDPEAMVRKYCETIGLPFHPDIMNWEKKKFTELPWEGPKFFRFMNWLVGCYKNALNSTGFKRGGFKKTGPVRHHEKRENDAFGENSVHGVSATSEANGEITSKLEATATPSEPDLSDLHSDVRKAVEYTMPFYNLLYERRVCLDKVARIPEQY